MTRVHSNYYIRTRTISESIEEEQEEQEEQEVHSLTESTRQMPNSRQHNLSGVY